VSLVDERRDPVGRRRPAGAEVRHGVAQGVDEREGIQEGLDVRPAEHEHGDIVCEAATTVNRGCLWQGIERVQPTPG
jgi:hypothetical protein